MRQTKKQIEPGEEGVLFTGRSFSPVDDSDVVFAPSGPKSSRGREAARY